MFESRRRKSVGKMGIIDLKYNTGGRKVSETRCSVEMETKEKKQPKVGYIWSMKRNSRTKMPSVVKIVIYIISSKAQQGGGKVLLH